MDARELGRLEAGGALTRLQGGKQGVRVSLQLRDRLPMSSFSVLREELGSRFLALAKELSGEGVEVDLGSISELSQSVEGALPADRYEELCEKLRGAGVRIAPVVRTQVAEGRSGS